MELKVYKDTVTAAESICDTKLELPVETEMLIPDYLPQVFKIVKCFVYLVVLQKQVTAGRLTVDGYLRCVVYYQSEGDAKSVSGGAKAAVHKTGGCEAGKLGPGDRACLGRDGVCELPGGQPATRGRPGRVRSVHRGRGRGTGA